MPSLRAGEGDAESTYDARIDERFSSTRGGGRPALRTCSTEREHQGRVEVGAFLYALIEFTEKGLISIEELGKRVPDVHGRLEKKNVDQGVGTLKRDHTPDVRRYANEALLHRVPK